MLLLQNSSEELGHKTRLSVQLRYPYFYNLVLLRLSNCSNCSHLPPLGLLSSLKHLTIEKMSGVNKLGPEFYGLVNCSPSSSVKPFPSLVTLVFQAMLEWQEWIFPEGGEFPCLEELFIQNCPNLTGSCLPKCLPPSIQKVEISLCPKLLITFPRFTGKDHLWLYDGNKLIFRKYAKLVNRPPRRLPVIEQLLKLFDRPTRIPILEELLQFLDGKMLQLRGSDHEVSEANSDASEEPRINSDTDEPVTTINTRNAAENLLDFISFKRLTVTETRELRELPLDLYSLTIEHCRALECLPEELTSYNYLYLRHLNLSDCCSLRFFHGGYLPTGLTKLCICNCRKLEFPSTVKTLHQYPLLDYLFLDRSCDSLRCLSLDQFPKLKTLAVRDCTNLDSISITKDHTSLVILDIRRCPKIVSFPEGGMPLATPNLRSFVILDCKYLKAIPNLRHNLSSLTELFIQECPELVSIPGGFPDTLRKLNIISCHKFRPCLDWRLHKLENLRSLNIEDGCEVLVMFPDRHALQLPNNLEYLRISKLPNLRYIDDLERLKSLNTLEINGCQKLMSLSFCIFPASLKFVNITECPLLNERSDRGKAQLRYLARRVHCVRVDGKLIKK